MTRSFASRLPAIVVALWAAGLSAQTPPGNDFIKLDAALFAKFDDGDGTLSREEIGAYPWLRYDADGDGAVAQGEFQLGRLQDRLNAKLEPNTEKSFALLDWTADGKLSGAELDGGVWLAFDADGNRVVDKAEYLNGKGTAPRPDMPANRETSSTWKRYVFDNVAIEMPGAPERSSEGGQIAYKVQVGKATYGLTFDKVADSAADADAVIQEIFKIIVEGVPGALVAKNEKITLRGHAGRELFLGVPDKFRHRRQMFLVDSQLVTASVSAPADATITPDDVEKFFNSLQFVEPPTPPAATGPAASHAAFVDALAAGDERAIYAMFHPEMQAGVDPAMMQLYFDLVKSELGKITAKSTDDLELTDESAGELKYQRGVDTLPCEHGSLKVTTGVADGRLVTFLLESPKLTPERISILTFKYLTDLGDETKDFAEQYAPQCKTFVNTLFDDGAESAFALLDPRIQAEFRTKGEPGKLAKIRVAFGPIKKLELASFRVEGHPQKGLDEFQIIFEAERPGKPVGTIRFSFVPDGLKAVIAGYSFEEPSEALPAAPKAPAESLRDLLDDDKPAAKTPPPSTAPPVAPPSIAPPIP